MMKARILSIGTDSDHFLRFIKYCDLQEDEDILMDVFLTSIYASVDVFKGRNNVYGVKVPRLIMPLLKIPRFRDVIILYYQKVAFRKLLYDKNYSLICIHQLKPYTLALTKFAKKRG